jgi:serine/threonine-protein kinase RsbW
MVLVRIPGSLRYRDLAVRAVAAASKLVGTGDRVFDDEVVSAFGEAFNNVAIHAYGEHSGEIEIQIDIGVEHLTIRLLDHGNSFDANEIKEPDLDALPESGLGMFIIRNFMDEVSYTAGSPNVLTMTKRYLARPRGSEPTS